MYVCMYVWLCWVFVSVRGLSLVVASGGHSSSRGSTPLLLFKILFPFGERDWEKKEAKIKVNRGRVGLGVWD